MSNDDDDYNSDEERAASQWVEMEVQEQCESCGHKFKKGEEYFGKLESLGRLEKICKNCANRGST